MGALDGQGGARRGRTRGAGRGIAVELGAAGATVYVTGRSGGGRRSGYGGAETIEETAALVTELGGEGVRSGSTTWCRRRSRRSSGGSATSAARLDILVNDIWGGERLFEWNKAVWEHDLENGLRLLRQGIDTHLITAHHALPLMIARPGGLLVEVTDGTAAYNAEHYRLSVFYDLVKTAATRMAWAHAKDLAPHGGTAVAVTPGWMRSEMMLEAFGVTEAAWRDAIAAAAAFRDLGDAAVPRPRGGGAGGGPGSGALVGAVAVERRAGEGLRLHRSRRLASGLLALPGRGGGGRAARRRDGLPVTGAGDPAALREAVVAHFPELAGARFRLLAPGWHSVAVDVDGRLVFKFPKDAVAEAALRREAGLLRALHGAVTLPIPELTLHGPPLFSRHRKIPGEPLLGTDYERLDIGGRQRLAEELARFHAELHGLDRARMGAAGATPVGPWSAPDDILRRVLPVLPRRLHGFAQATLDEWRAMPAGPGRDGLRLLRRAWLEHGLRSRARAAERDL